MRDGVAGEAASPVERGGIEGGFEAEFGQSGLDREVFEVGDDSPADAGSHPVGVDEDRIDLAGIEIDQASADDPVVVAALEWLQSAE